MEARLTNPATPETIQAIQTILKATREGGVPQKTLELVHLRASQINGCSFCVDSGAKSAKRAGETDERLFAVAAWREAPYFTEAERAALALTEAATRLADRSDPVRTRSGKRSPGTMTERSVRDRSHDRHNQLLQPHQRHHQESGRFGLVIPRRSPAILPSSYEAGGKLAALHTGEAVRQAAWRHRLACAAFSSANRRASAGAFFVYTGAAASGVVRGWDDPGTLIWGPLFFAVITLASWALRPQSRVLGVLFPTKKLA